MAKRRKLILVKSSSAGDWLPSSCMAIERLPQRRLDVDGLYMVLGIEPDATDAEIRSAGKRRMLESHPDVGGDQFEFEAVLEAYRVLSDPAKRAAYDAMVPKGGVSMNLVGCEPVAEAGTAPSGACFYKGMSDLLTDGDVESVYAWQELVLEAARSFGAVIEVAVGISYAVERYALQDGVAVKPAGMELDSGMAKAYVLYKMTEKRTRQKPKKEK